jgi:hypothetical protein
MVSLFYNQFNNSTFSFDCNNTHWWKQYCKCQITKKILWWYTAIKYSIFCKETQCQKLLITEKKLQFVTQLYKYNWCSDFIKKQYTSNTITAFHHVYICCLCSYMPPSHTESDLRCFAEINCSTVQKIHQE